MYEECPFCRINYKLDSKGRIRKHNRQVGRRGYYIIKDVCPGSGKTPNTVCTRLETGAAQPRYEVLTKIGQGD